MSRRTASATLALVLSLSACSDGEPARVGTSSVRDSAGVEIVESRAPAWGDDGGWRLAAEPTLTLGDGELFFERVVGVRLLAGDGVAVLDAGDASLRIFDAAGVLVERWGRYGEGPEEFQGPGGLLGLPGDTLVVWDPPSTSLSRFVPGEGQVGRIALTRVDGVQLREPTLLADGRTLMPGFAWPAGGGQQDPGLYRGTAPILVHAPDGSGVDTLALRPARQVMVAEVMGRSLVGDAPFAPNLHATWVAAAPDARESGPGSPLAAVGDGAPVPGPDGGWLWQVEYLDGNEVRRIARGSADDPTLTDDDRSWYLDQLASRAASPQELAMMGQMRRAIIWPDRRRIWNDMLADAAGHLWLRLGRHLPPSTLSTEWRILSPTGRWLGDLSLPDGFDPMHVTRDAVTGVHTDGLGVPRVRVYRLNRESR